MGSSRVVKEEDEELIAESINPSHRSTANASQVLEMERKKK